MEPSLQLFGWRKPVLDIVYVAAILGLFGLIALVAWGVEKL